MREQIAIVLIQLVLRYRIEHGTRFTRVLHFPKDDCFLEQIAPNPIAVVVGNCQSDGDVFEGFFGGDSPVMFWTSLGT